MKSPFKMAVNNNNINFDHNNQLNIEYLINNHSNRTHINDINILYINIRSLRNKLQDLELLIHEQKTLTHIIALTEVFIYENETQYYNINGYDKMFTTRQDRSGGGCAIYIHHSLTANQIYGKEWNGNCILGANIINDKLKFNFFVIYRAHHKQQSDLLDFFDEITHMFYNFKNSYYVGDFNLNLLNQSINLDVSRYIDIIHSAGHLLLNKNNNMYPTRVISGTIIDHVITDNFQYPYTLSIHDTHISDHRYSYLNIHNINIPKQNQYINPKVLNVIEYNKINNTDINIINNSNDINSFIANIQNTISKYSKVLTLKNKTRTKKPWINKDILNTLKHQKTYFKLKTKYPSNNFFYQQFIYYRNKATYKIRESKKNYYSNQMNSAIYNNRKFWSITNEIIFNTTKNNPSQKNYILNINNQLSSNELEIANYFNSFFTNTGNTQNNPNSQPMNANVPTNRNYSFYIRKINKDDVVKVLESINLSAANGYDNIPIKFISRFSNELSQKITDLINISIQTSNFPNCLKIAKITPIYKKDDKKEVNNYRPISVLPCISKIYEKIIQQQLEKYLNENKIINPNQFGFVTNSSTLAACTQLINFVEQNIDQNNYVSCIFLDLQKAFDTIDHNILYQKFTRIGIHHRALQLLQSYHNNRKQFVQIRNTSSSLTNPELGVGQGSILSTTEFSIYINDIFEVQLKGKLQLYADDAVVMYSDCNFQNLYTNMQTDILLIDDFLKQNKLKLNIKKSNYIIFDKHKVIENVPIILVNNNPLLRVYNTKYLGLNIDSKLSWNEHIHQLKNKIKPVTFVLYRLRYYLNKATMWNIYHAYFLSRLIYLIPIWSSASTSKLYELETLQNRTLRVIHGYSRFHARIDLYGVNILPLNKLIKFHLLVLIFSLNKNLIKHNLEITYRYMIHSHNTRRQSHIQTSLSRTNTGLNSILNRGYSLFNNLPTEIKHSHKISEFKRKLLECLNAVAWPP